MDFTLSKEHEMLRKMYREFAQNEVKPLAQEIDEEERFPSETIPKLAKLGLLEGRRATCYPGCEDEMAGAVMQNAGVVRDGRIITGRAAGAAADFGLALLAALKGEDEAKRVAAGIVYER